MDIPPLYRFSTSNLYTSTLVYDRHYRYCRTNNELIIWRRSTVLHCIQQNALMFIEKRVMQVCTLANWLNTRPQYQSCTGGGFGNSCPTPYWRGCCAPRGRGFVCFSKIFLLVYEHMVRSKPFLITVSYV